VDNVKVKDLKKFIGSVEKKYGKKAEEFEIEVHHPFQVNGKEAFSPHEVEALRVAKYKGDKNPVVVIR
jgi:hypothetical protein